MIDLHCHILPGIDDGAKTLTEALDMAELALKEGITHILATPHHKNRDWDNPKSKVIKCVDELNSELKNNGIELTIFPGQEIRLYGELVSDIEKGEILFTDEGNNYMLIEFPTSSIPSYAERLFYNLQSDGITPVIVHPERNHAIIQDPNKLKGFVDKGALAQLTAASYTGGFGKKIEKLSKQLVEANLVHFMASDAHNTTNRSFHMREAYEKLAKDFGRSKRNTFHQTTKDLLNGDVLIAPETSKIKQSIFLKWF